MSADGGLGLLFAAILQRLDRIEAALGLTEPTPAQAEFEAWDDEQDANEGDA